MHNSKRLISISTFSPFQSHGDISWVFFGSLDGPPWFLKRCLLGLLLLVRLVLPFGIEKHIYCSVVGLSSWMDFPVAGSLAFVLINIFITIKHDYNMSSETIFGNSNFILLFFLKKNHILEKHINSLEVMHPPLMNIDLYILGVNYYFSS